MSYKDVVIVSAFRTAIGRFGGSLKDVSVVEMTSQLLKQSLDHLNIEDQKIDEVFIGNVLSAGLGQNIARQVAISAGLDSSTPATTVNQVCGSGLKAVMLAYQSILTNENQIVVAGGCENMSQSPFLLKDYRFGKKLGNSQLIDSMIQDGLTDAFSGDHMGITAENLADKYNITREEQDQFALESQQKAENAQKNGHFKSQILPINYQVKGESLVFDQDEGIRYGQSLEALAHLRPAFKREGTVTAGNSSTINDGAAVLVLMTAEKAKELNLEVLAHVKAIGQAGVDPSIMGTGPIAAVQKVLAKTDLTVDQIDLIESNEAFAVQSLVVNQELGLQADKVNVNGGAIALGHPIGSSGARILVTLLHEMKRRQAKLGLATLCIGGGQGNAILVEA